MDRRILDALVIAKPCPASWDAMAGDDRVRHCELCKLNVYNIAALTNADALGLIERSEGRLCVRLYKRADGTVLTVDCPVGVRAAWRRLMQLAAMGLAVILYVFAVFSMSLASGKRASGNTFVKAQDSAKEALVKYLPHWMIPNGWMPDLDPNFSMGFPNNPDLFEPLQPPLQISR
jgi:hypothetical protein